MLRYSAALDESLTTTLSARNDGGSPLRFNLETAEAVSGKSNNPSLSVVYDWL